MSIELRINNINDDIMEGGLVFFPKFINLCQEKLDTPFLQMTNATIHLLSFAFLRLLRRDLLLTVF